MIRKLVFACLVAALAAPAFAEDAPKPAATSGAPAAAPDMQHMGPATRIPKNEKADKKELDAYFKASKEASEKGDVQAMADLVDFPVLMMTDDAKGVFSSKEASREDWINMMKPFMDPKAMKDAKMTMTGQCFILSDDLASCEGANAMMVGKNKVKWNSQMLLTRKDGKWKAKTMVEAGWGDATQAPHAQN